MVTTSQSVTVEADAHERWLDVIVDAEATPPARTTARYPESRARSLGLVGLALGMAIAVGAATYGAGGPGMLACIATVAAGIAIGRRYPRWYCARCNAQVLPRAPRCTGCGATIVRALAHARDRLDDHDEPHRGALAHAPYRGGGSGLDFAAADIDGTAVPRIDGVLRPSTEGEPLTPATLEQLQRNFDVVLSPSHAEYMMTLGPGVDSDIVELWSPVRIAAERHASLAWIRGIHWDAADRLAELSTELCVVIGTTDEGDRLALHPALPGRVLWMRAQVQEIVECADGFGAALDEVCGLPADRVRWFAPPTVATRATLQVDGELTALLGRILDFGAVCLQREHEETDDDESWLVLSPGVGGWVRLARAACRGPWTVEIASDVHNADVARRLAGALVEPAGI